MSINNSSAKQFGWFTPRHLVWLTVALISGLVLSGTVWWIFQSLSATKITAYFQRTVGIYEGSDVRIVGVKVGSVESVEPQGDRVKVVFKVERGVELPAEVRALQITPSVVADRYIQLTPAYTGGKKAGKNLHLSLNQTMVPVEVDDLYKSVQQLTKALGPDGANKNGVVTKAINVGAKNLAGNGEILGETITSLSGAVTTLNNSRGNLVDTVKNLNTFVGALANNDAQVRQFNSQLAGFNSFLAGERQQLGQALNTLSISLGELTTFVDDNRIALGDTVKSLLPTTKLLAETKDQQAEALVMLPLAVSNLINAYNAESGTLDLRLDLPQLQMLLKTSCGILDLGKLKPGDPAFVDFSNKLAPIIRICESMTGPIDSAIQKLGLNLPFGLMSGDALQKSGGVPGTVRGTPSPGLPKGLVK